MESLHSLQENTGDLFFLPNRWISPEGIYGTAIPILMELWDEAYELYNDFYKDAAFTQVTKRTLPLKQ